MLSFSHVAEALTGLIYHRPSGENFSSACVPVAKNAPLDNDSSSTKAACFHFHVPPNRFQKICFKSEGPKIASNL